MRRPLKFLCRTGRVLPLLDASRSTSVSALVTICTEAPNQFALARTLALSAFSTTEHQQAIRCRAARLTRGELRRTGGRFGAKHGVRRKSAFQRLLLAQGDPSRS